MIYNLITIDDRVFLGINGLANTSAFWRVVFQFFGIYLIYFVPVMLILLWFWSEKSKKISLSATLAGLLCWLVFAKIIAYIIKRPRPAHVSGVRELLFTRPDYAFPSDHTAFLFAITFSLFFAGFKKLGWAMLIVSTLIGFSRIGIGAHHPFDIIAGAILGILIAWLVQAFDGSLGRIYNLIISFAKKMKLA